MAHGAPKADGRHGDADPGSRNRLTFLYWHGVHAPTRRGIDSGGNPKAARRVADRVGGNEQTGGATLRAFPEIQDIVIKIGRPDFATEAMGINEGDTYVLPRPVKTWTRFHTKEDLIEAMYKELSKIPGIAYSFTQPMAMRVDETVSGVKADLAIKV